MSTRFPVVTSKEIVRVLEKMGFVFVRQTGSSHAIYKHPSKNKRTVVPIHSGVSLKRRTLKAILRDAELDIEDLRKLL
ncbi:MAG: type II toxin-antitoxin system HicA family toxin [Deltaproteobacteria bacterium]|nr:type II toxin-antitoxin system HicA family toxin [Deltaproteobacteria bacterium]